jgi:MFS family permease
VRRLWTASGWGALAVDAAVGRPLAVIAVVDAAGTGLFLGSLAVLLVATVGLSASTVGVGLAVAGACRLLATVPMGMLADRVGTGRFLVGSALAQALAYAAYLLVDSAPSFVLVASLVGVAQAGNQGAYQALLGGLVEEERRVGAMAAVRSLRNAGYALGGAGAGVVLAVRGGWGLDAVAAANAASFLVIAALYARLPRVRASPEPRARALVALRDRPYVGLTVVSTVYATSMVLLDVGIPLWLVERTDAPHFVAGAVLVLNTVLVILLQVRAARAADTVEGAVALTRRSAVFFAAACALLAVSGSPGALGATLVLLAGAVLLTFGEMLESAAWWTLSYELADPARRSEYLATFSLNFAVLAIVGPLLMALVVALGPGGWLALGALFLLASVLVAPLVRAAGAGGRLAEATR